MLILACGSGVDREADAPERGRPDSGAAVATTGTSGPAELSAAPREDPVAVVAPAPGLTTPEPPPVSDRCHRRAASAMRPCSDEPDPCGLRSGFEGDAYCLTPPPVGEGIQIHFGPKSYTDAGALDGYVIASDEEVYQSVLAHVPLDSDRYYDHITVSMRPGVHRWSASGVMGHPEEGRYAGSACAGSLPGIGGGRALIYDNPPHGVAAPENEGIASIIRGNSSQCMNVLAYNDTSKPRLVEVWVNLRFVEASRVTQSISSIGLVGGRALNLAPGVSKIATYQVTFSEAGRIIQLFGDRHMSTSRLAVWLNDRLIYDSYDWQAAVRYNYDSITTNPAIDPAGILDGAVSGILPFEAGDTLKLSCFIENKSDVNLLALNQQVRDADHCDLGGATIGGGIPLTVFQ